MSEYLLSDAQRKDFRKEKMMNANFDELEKKKLSRTELKEQRINELFDSCRENVLQQIIGPFGLTPAMFNDKVGGNVATVHNADNNVFPDELHEQNYEIANDPYSQQVRQKHWDDKSARGEIHKENNQALDAGQDVLSDVTQKPMTKGDIDGDHTVSLKEAHGNKAMHLRFSEKERKQILNNQKNMAFIEASLNRSKGERSWDDCLSDSEFIKKNNLSPEDIKRIKKVDKEARGYIQKEQNQRLAGELISTGVKEAGNNALRQATGLLLHELVSGTYIEIKRIAKEPALQEEFIEHVIEALKKVAERVQSKFDHIFNSIVSGGVQGFVSNFLTFLINNLVTTSAKVVTIIRESMKGLWEAIKLIVNPPEGEDALDVARKATKIIAGVVTMGLGLFFEKSVEAFILSIPLLAPMASVIAPAATAILTGIATALVIYGIDRFFDWLSRAGAELLNAQIENMEAAAEMIERMAQFIQVQFDNSRQYQLCIEQYRKIEFELTISQRNMHNALDYAGSSVKSKEVFEEKLGVVKQLNNELAEVEDLLRAYEKK